jgi:ATP-dependent DNA helicase RecG
MVTLDTNLSALPRIGEKYLRKLKKLGVETVRDLFWHFPFRYDDYTRISKISNLSNGQTSTVVGKITDSKTTRTWKRRMFVTEALVQDDTGTVKVIWFNQPYLSDSILIGKTIRLSGKVSADSSGLFFASPIWESASREPTNTGRLVPVYPETEGISSRWLRWQIQILFKLKFKLLDPIPPDILKKLNLPSLEKALKYIHFPESENQYLLARKRFAFEEMFLVQLKSIQVKLLWDQEKAVKIKFDEKLIQNFTTSLPFKLTNAQRKATYEILKDLEKPRPMNRLLNGDVGSGKTIVAAIASLQVSSGRYQVAIMAPTEVLARQHFLTFSKLLRKYDTTVALLTNSYQEINNFKFKISKNKKTNRDILLKKIFSGEINLIIGTHALIQKDVEFHNLALIIVDEQHRFGVNQRAYLQQKSAEMSDGLKNFTPHFLTMTATPIPRTLALAFFGNLDLSILDEMPKNRKKIITRFIGPLERQSTYEFIKKEIAHSRQCFVILPLVEESKILTEVKAAIQEYERLSKDIFHGFRLGLLHGRLKSTEKEKVMAEFDSKKIDILVATAVVEVGIDIPNATLMIIEDADRFGLAQLHQFRGRIGRGEHQSYCFLFSTSDTINAKKRLRALIESNNGFKIAEEDLKLRGPGEFFGTRQSGLPDIAMENLSNLKLIQVARVEAQEILKIDSGLEKFPGLKEELLQFDQDIHLE